MNLTDEQIDIIELSKKLKSNEILSIQACAGSGKTYTLREIALQNPNKRFLYLAFNKAIVAESKNKFPKNVEVKTLHSLALSYTQKKLKDFKLIHNINIFDLQKILVAENDKLIFALKSFNRFLKSNESLESQPNFIHKLYQAVLNKELPMFHNFYLKYYALAKDKNLEREYDCILLDEAQDSNAVMLSIFLNNTCPKILVGDTFQNIYGFNDSINAFHIITPTYQSTLNTSFRCTQRILDYANFFLKYFSSKNFKHMKSSIKEQKQDLDDKAIISRTNAKIIEFINEIDQKQENDFALLKEPHKIFAPLYAVLYFRSAKLDLIPQEYAYFKNFSTTKELYAYIEKMQDKELLSALNLLNKEIDIDKVSKRAKKLFCNKDAKNFIINAHQAKGLEWNKVELLNDFSPLMELKKRIDEERQASKRKELDFILEQELNLFYVAITRAKNELIDMSENYRLWVRYKNRNSVHI